MNVKSMYVYITRFIQIIKLFTRVSISREKYRKYLYETTTSNFTIIGIGRHEKDISIHPNG